MNQWTRTVGMWAAGLAASVMMVGCAVEGGPDIPAGALMTTEGSGQLAYRADGDGTAYVYDVDKGAIVYSGRLRDGEVLSVEPDKDRIRIGDRTAVEPKLGDNQRRIFFEKESPERRIVIDGDGRRDEGVELRLRDDQRDDVELRVRD